MAGGIGGTPFLRVHMYPSYSTYYSAVQTRGSKIQRQLRVHVPDAQPLLTIAQFILWSFQLDTVQAEGEGGPSRLPERGLEVWNSNCAKSTREYIY